MGLGNYQSAIPIVEKMLHVAHNCIILQRLNFFGSLKRNEWWSTHMPWRLYPLSERPIFTEDGSDACEYGWFHWRKGVPRGRGVPTLLEAPLPADVEGT